MDVSPPEFREVRPREALAVLELPEIHPGLFVLDAMVKEAPIEVLSATPIPPGRFLIVVTGAVGEVESAYHRGATLAERGGGNVPGHVTGDVMGRATGHAAGRVTVHDRLFLADVAPAVLAALRPDRKEREIDALGIFETASVASCLDASDRLVKGADVRLEQLHLARGIAGRSFGVVTGRQDMVEAALELAEERGEHHARWVGSSLIARPDPSIARRVLGEPWGFFEGQEIL